MSTKSTYRAVAVLLLSGIAIILLIASLMIRQPGLLAGLASISPSITSSPPLSVIQETQILPVNTATSQDYSQAVSATEPAHSETPTSTTEHKITQTQLQQMQTAVATPEPSNSSLCGGTGQTLIFVTVFSPAQETDAPEIAFLGYLEIDFEKPGVYLLLLPSNLTVSGSTIKQLNLPPTQLKDLFAFTVANISDPALDPARVGISVVARAIYDETRLYPQAYLSINTTDLAALIDAVGGLSLKSSSLHEGSLPDGVYSGEEIALKLEQIDRAFDTSLLHQQQIALAALEKFKQPSFAEKVGDLVSIFNEIALTNMNQNNLYQYICALGTIKSDDIHVFVPETSDFSFSGDGIFFSDASQINRFFD